MSTDWTWRNLSLFCYTDALKCVQSCIFVIHVQYSLPALWVQRTEYDGVDSVVSPEEQPAGSNKESVWTHQISNLCVFVYVWPAGTQNAHFRWLSVSVIPCAETLKCTTVEGGGGSMESVTVVAFWTAWCPVRDSSSTEPRYHTLHATTTQRKNKSDKLLLIINDYSVRTN